MISRLRSVLTNLFPCCLKPRHEETAIDVVRQPTATAATANPGSSTQPQRQQLLAFQLAQLTQGRQRLSAFQAAQMTPLQVPTPNVRAPIERRSSLSLYEKRRQRLTRTQSTASISPDENDDDEQPSPTKCSVQQQQRQELTQQRQPVTSQRQEIMPQRHQVSDMDDEDQSSPTQCSVMEKPVRLHFFADDNTYDDTQQQTQQHEQQEKQGKGNKEEEDQEDIDAIFEKYKRQMSKL